MRPALSWRHGSDNQSIALDEHFYRLALRIVTRSMMSADLGARTIDEFVRSLPDVLNVMSKRAISPIHVQELLPTPANRRFNAAVSRLWSALDSTVSGYCAADTDNGDLLSILLGVRDEQTGEGMTHRQLMDEAMTIAIAGSETTANTLSWAAHMLSTNPSVQQRLQDEVDEVLGGREAGLEDIPRLTYTRQVISETLRLYTPSWILARHPVADVNLGGHRIPQGSRVILSPYALDNDPEIYPQPDRFDPDRWTTGVRRSTFEFLPFGAGIHGCIGENFAWSETVIVLSSVAAQWTLQPIPEKPTTATIRMSLQPDQLYMRIVRRNT